MKKLIGLIVFGGLIATVIAVAISPEAERREKLRREQEQEAKAAKAAKDQRDEAWRKSLKAYSDKRAEDARGPREAGFDQGFQLGFMGGKLTRSKTNIAISGQRIEVLANEQLEKQNVPADAHAGFVRGFKAGWSSGWTSK